MIDRWYFAAAPATRLAALRVLIGGYAWVYLLARAVEIVGVSRFAARQFAPVGPVAILSSPLPGWVVAVTVIASIVAGAAFVAGYRYRIAGPTFAVLLLWATSYRNSWGMVFHTENLIVLHVAVLGLSRAADAWSLDARGRELPEPSGRYGWPIRLLCLVTVSTYVLAGVSKLLISGPSWVTSGTLRDQIAYDNLRKLELGAGASPLGTWLVAHGWLFPPLAAGSLAMELGAPIALLGPRIGRVWCAAAWCFHAGVVLLMAIFFHYPLLGVAFASFFEVERLGERVIRWRQRRRGAD